MILDNDDVFTLSEDVFFQNSFHVGDQLSSEMLSSMQYEDSMLRSKQAALNLLSYRKRSKAELSRRLKEKGFQESIIKDTLNTLLSKGYVNDEAFAKSFARDKVRQSKIGPIKLTIELKKHGITDTVLKRTEDSVYAEFPISHIIHNLIQKKGYNLNEPDEKNKCIQFLQRKGFPLDAIFSEINKNELS